METPFEIAQKQVRAKTLQTPSVSVGTKPVDYFSYQLAVHKFNLKIMAGGMTCRGIKFKQIKEYYGLKGRSAKDCIEQFETIIQEYKKSLILTNTKTN